MTIKQTEYMQELNSISIGKRQRGLIKTQVSDAIMIRYKGRNHPPFEIKKAEENRLRFPETLDEHELENK